MEPVLDAALSAEGPVVIEAIVDPYEPMPPPKMPADYARNFSNALPLTTGHEFIEENLSEEPVRSMMASPD